MEQYVQHGAIGTPLRVLRIIAIEAVLANIEEEGAEVFVAEIDQQARVGIEVKIIDRLLQLAVQLCQFGQDIDFEFGDLCVVPHLADKPVQRAEQVAEGVAQLAIGIAHTFEDFIADPVIFGEIDAQRPQADNVCAVLLHHLERVDRIAEALGHFHALGVHGEAVGQHRLVRRTAACAAAFQQGGLEPAAMLVAAFQIEVCGRLQFGPFVRFEHESMG